MSPGSSKRQRTRINDLFRGYDRQRRLNGDIATHIQPNLTSGPVNVGIARQLNECDNAAFIGTQKNGPFDIDGSTARLWLSMPQNPNGRPSSHVVRPWTNGAGIVQRDPDKWIIDFGANRAQSDAARRAALCPCSSLT